MTVNETRLRESNPNEPTFVFDELSLYWQMTRCEKYAFASLLQTIKPQVAIEIGTYQGGSLQIISQNSQRVYAIDIAPRQETLAPHFHNVEFLTGDSKQVLPALLQRLSANGKALGFVLIDGDHSAEGVRADINALLQYTPRVPLYIVCHDSFNPACRTGMLTANWQACPFVHYLEVDFIPGVYHYEGFDHAEPRSMWGGFAVAVMLPHARAHELQIHQSQKGLYDTMLANSQHASANKMNPRGFFWKIKRRVAKLARAN